MFCRVRRFSDEQCGIRDATRDFVRKEIAPFAAEWDRTATVPLQTVRRAGALGLFGVCVPAEWRSWRRSWGVRGRDSCFGIGLDGERRAGWTGDWWGDKQCSLGGGVL